MLYSHNDDLKENADFFSWIFSSKSFAIIPILTRSFTAVPVPSHVSRRPAVHVRRTLESSTLLALLNHGGLCVGHARGQQGALWRAGSSKPSVRLLVHTCVGRVKKHQTQPPHKSTHFLTNEGVRMTVTFQMFCENVRIFENQTWSRTKRKHGGYYVLEEKFQSAFRVMYRQLVFPTCTETGRDDEAVPREKN